MAKSRPSITSRNSSNINLTALPAMLQMTSSADLGFVVYVALGMTCKSLRARSSRRSVRGLNDGAVSGSTLREIASAFNSFVSQYVKQLLAGVPIIPARKNRLQNMRFHNLTSVPDELKETFGIDLFSGLKAADMEHASLMYYRRHVYEHNGGQVDAQYLQESGDTTVRLNQALREDVGSLHRFANSVARMARNLHEGVPPNFSDRGRADESLSGQEGPNGGMGEARPVSEPPNL